MIPFQVTQESELEKWRVGSFWTKEPETIAWIQSFNGGVFYDVGANIGLYSLYCARLYPKMHVYAFEPNPGNFSALAANRKQNRFSRMYCLIHCVGNHQGVVNLDIPDPTPGATGAQAGRGSFPSVMVTIDSLPDTPDYIKIDTDGNEIDVLRGARKVLRWVKGVLVEVSSATRDEAIMLLTAAGLEPDPLNDMTPHSRERRAHEGIDAENLIYRRP